MTFLCDVIIRVSIKVSFPHLYVLLANPDEIVLQKVIFSCVRAMFFSFVFKYQSLPQKITPQIRLSNLIRGTLYSLSIFETLYVF